MSPAIGFLAFWYMLLVFLMPAAVADAFWREDPSERRLFFYGICGLLWPIALVLVILPAALGAFGQLWAAWAKRTRESL